MKPLATATLIMATTLVAVAPLAAPAGAAQLGTTMPSNCVAHTSFSSNADSDGDYRCAGIAIPYHTGGFERSPFPIWAGQWLFTDAQGQFRVGSCTFNRGEHPTINEPSYPVTQNFPNDPTGAKGAYLTWRYGDTTDNLTAAAMWTVFHYYAQDVAGTSRASNSTSSLVPALDTIAAASGSDVLQARALQLNDEAVRYADQWQLTVAVALDGVVTATLLSGSTPVPEQPISVLVSGSDLPFAATTNADGKATVTVSPPSGTVTVVATTKGPGAATVFRGTAASPDPQGAQTLVTGGEPIALTATARLEVTPPPTTVPPTTVPVTTVPATTVPVTTVPITTVPVTTLPDTTTTVPETTTTVPATTTTVPATTTTTTTVPETTTTTTIPETTTTTALPIVPITPITVQQLVSLPRTGGGGDGTVAYAATAMLVGGIGLLGTLRRRGLLAYTHEGDAG